MNPNGRNERAHRANLKAEQQLGMTPGCATIRLRRSILFSLVQQTGQDICYRCGKEIETAEELSIEHKISWLDSENPINLYFDLNNIAFSHRNCNVGYNRHARGHRENTPHGDWRYRNGCRCEICTVAHSIVLRNKRIKYNPTHYSKHNKEII